MEYNNLQIRNPKNNIILSIIGGAGILIKTWRCALNKEVNKECRQQRPICKGDKNHSSDQTKYLHLAEIKACLHLSPSLQPPFCSCIFSTLSLCTANLWYRWDQCDRPLSEPTVSIALIPARVLLCKGAQDGRTSWNPSEDVFGLDHSAHRSSADSRSDTSYFISSFGLLPPHCAVINTGMGWPIFFSLLVP